MLSENHLKLIESNIKSVPNFPKEGIVFKDIGPLMKDHFPVMINGFIEQDVNWKNVDYIVGIESRGFIIGSAIARHLNKGFIPLRKKGKLPPPLISESYSLEYGHDTLEMQANEIHSRVVIIDDVLATGGTLNAAVNLCRKNNYQIEAVSVLINLSFLNQFTAKHSIPLFSVLTY